MKRLFYYLFKWFPFLEAKAIDALMEIWTKRENLWFDPSARNHFEHLDNAEMILDESNTDSYRLCQYEDCSENHPIANDSEQVTCETCRRELGLAPINN